MIDVLMFITAAVLALVSFLLGRETKGAKQDSAAAQREVARTDAVIEAIEEDLKGDTPEEDLANRWNKI
tara:strand:- start:283 stop:489 length:207 start_codon:yes stop_codon:yes gene_type:complete